MFVNPLGEWNMARNGLKNSDEYIIWQEAEKKVIFENGLNTLSYIESRNFINNTSITVDQIRSGNTPKNITTLHDLSEATNGELTLRNVEI